MDAELKERLASLFESGSGIMKSLPRRRRHRIDEVEVVFVDLINGRAKPRRAFTFMDIMEAVEDGAKAIGLIIVDWSDPEKMEMKEFAKLSTEEQSILAAAFAESQDQQKEEYGDDD